MRAFRQFDLDHLGRISCPNLQGGNFGGKALGVAPRGGRLQLDRPAAGRQPVADILQHQAAAPAGHGIEDGGNAGGLAQVSLEKAGIGRWRQTLNRCRRFRHSAARRPAEQAVTASCNRYTIV